MIVLNFCFKEFRFGLHADSIVLMNFLHALGSIECTFVSGPDAFKQTLGLFCCYYAFIYPSWNVLSLGMFSVRWCIFVNKSRQGRMVLVVQSIGFFWRIDKEFRSNIFFHFLFVNLWYLRKVTAALIWDIGVERFRLEVIKNGHRRRLWYGD